MRANISINSSHVYMYRLTNRCNQYNGKEKKGKEEYYYSAILADTPLTKRSDMDHTVLPANYTMSAIMS